MLTGLQGFDAVVGALMPGQVWCVAGRPCMGKTALLLDVALRVLERHATNVVFGTAQEEAARILLRAPPGTMSRFMPLPCIDRVFDGIEAGWHPEPHIYLLDVQDLGAAQVHCVAHRLKVAHPAGCGLAVSNGWAVRPLRPTRMERVVDGHRYAIEWERPARRLGVNQLMRAQRDAAAAGVPMLYGVCTAVAREGRGGPDVDELRAGPKVEHLHALQSVLRPGAVGAVLVHRPELYYADDEGRAAFEGVVELSSAVGVERRSASLSYRREEKRFADLWRH